MRNEFIRNNPAPRYGFSGSVPPQVVARVDVSRKMEASDPVGMMTMSANLVEVFNGGGVDEFNRLKAKVAYLEAAMAEKRGRTGDTTVSDELSRRRPRREERSASPNRSRSQHQTARIRSPRVPQPISKGTLPLAVRMDVPLPEDGEPMDEDPAVQDNILPAPEGQPFVPDPYFADPAVYSQFLPTTTVPKTRKKRGPPKPRRHIKMMQGVPEWNPVEILKNTPVTGLSMANLLDLAPAARIAIVKALQLEQEKGAGQNKRPKGKARGPSG